jgi:mitochondrial fission protein ELM1
LPNALYDFCIVPEHDRPTPAEHIPVTRGTLKRIRVTNNPEPQRGLILIGGPSRHYRWNNREVAARIITLIRCDPARTWLLTTSRRTAGGFAEHLQRNLRRACRHLEVVTYAETSPAWLVRQFARTCCAWVTEDSVSMPYEALTAHVAVGLLSVPPRRAGRVSRGVGGLVGEGVVMRFANWCNGRALRRPAARFDGAERCAQWIHE